jgi:hypothetical protein
MTLIATLKSLKETLFDSTDSEDLSIGKRLERERDAHFEVLRRRGAYPLR